MTKTRFFLIFPFALIIFLLVYLAGCQLNIVNEGPASLNTPGDISDEISSTVEESPTEDFRLEKTPEMSDSYFTSNCVSIVGDMPSSSLMGELVIEPADGSPTFLNDISTGGKIYIGNSVWPYIEASPTFSQLAFWDVDKHTLLVVSPEGEVQASIMPAEDEELAPMHWISESEILVEDDYINSGIFGDFDYLIWDLDADTLSKLDFPIPTVDQAFDWFHEPLLIPNESKTYLVHPTLSNDVVLLDLDSNEEIVTIYDAGLYSNSPIWSSDGKSFILGLPLRYKVDGEVLENFDDGLPYIGGAELFRINIEGEFQRVTYLSTENKVNIWNLAWSPDETAIAFWLEFSDSSDDGMSLAFANVDSGVTTDLCISGYDEIYWSPDGRYLAINAARPNDPGSDVVLIDLELMEGYRIFERAYIVGILN